MEHEAPVFPGMVEVITHLAETYTLVVVSSTITPPIREKLERSGIASCFAEILGNDVHPSKEEKLRMVFATHATRPDDCVFVTDTAGDVREAARVGVGSIGVSWGYQPREMVEKANPFLIVDSPRAIVGAVEQYFRRPIS
jgi:phosphoglycolate phosphatase